MTQRGLVEEEAAEVEIAHLEIATKEIVAKRNLEDAVFTVEPQQNTQTLHQMPRNRNIEGRLDDKTDEEIGKHE